MKKTTSLLTLALFFFFHYSIAQNSGTSKVDGYKINSTKGIVVSSSSSSSKSLFEQSDTEYDFNTSIELDGHSQTEEVIVSIPEGSKQMMFRVQCFTENGSVMVELIDNNGEKQGNFKVGTDPKPGKKERASGSMKKDISDPGVGEWKVRITPNKAKGSVRVLSKFK